MNPESETLMLDYLYGELSEEAAASFESRLYADADLSAELEGLRAAIEMIDEDSAFGALCEEDVPPSHLRDAIFRQEALERVPEIRHAALQVGSPAREENTPWIHRMSMWLFGGGSLALGAAVVLFYIANPLSDAPKSLSELAKSAPSTASVAQDAEQDLEEEAFAKAEKNAPKKDVIRTSAPANAPIAKGNVKERKRPADKSDKYALSKEVLKDAEQRRGRLLKNEESATQNAARPAETNVEKRDPSEMKPRKSKSKSKSRRKSKKSMAYDQLSEELASQKAAPAPASGQAKGQGFGVGGISSRALAPVAESAAPNVQSAAAEPTPYAAAAATEDEADGDESAAFADDAAPARAKAGPKRRLAQKTSPRPASAGHRGPPSLPPAAKKRAKIMRERQARKRAQNPEDEARRKEQAKTEASKSDDEIQMILATALRELNQGNAINALDLFRRAEVKDRTHHAGVIPVVGQMQALEAMKQYQSALHLMPRILRAKKGTEGVPQGLEVGARLAEKTGDTQKATHYYKKLLRYKKYRTAARKKLKQQTRARKKAKPASASPVKGKSP